MGGKGENVTLNFGADGHLYLLNSTGSNIQNITEGGLPTDEGKLYLMRIDAKGIFRLYSHDLKKNAIWSVEWESSKNKCDPKGLCGLNSYCVLSDLKAECRCLPGFESVNQGNPTSGCERNFVADACKNRNENFTYTMEELESTTWEDVSYTSLVLSNKDDCIQGCLEDCDCAAAFFDDTNCSKQRLPLKYGRRENGTSNIALIKVGVPKPDTDRRIVQPGSKKKGETNPMVENELLEWMESDRSTGDVNGLQNDGKMGNNLTRFASDAVDAEMPSTPSSSSHPSSPAAIDAIFIPDFVDTRKLTP
ncbi:hypothetical protein ACE6H2_020398 [Prunus campanulata]